MDGRLLTLACQTQSSLSEKVQAEDDLLDRSESSCFSSSRYQHGIMSYIDNYNGYAVATSNSAVMVTGDVLC